MATKKRYYPLRSPANPTKVVLVEITEEQYQAYSLKSGRQENENYAPT